MKQEWLITFRSVTFAQRAQRVLLAGNISCRLQRTPKRLSERGCGYCLRLMGVDMPMAMERLRREQVAYGKLYTLGEDGSVEEQNHDLFG